MERENESSGGLLGRIYGGLNMSWPVVILLAVGAAVLTLIFLFVPAFKDTSFERMGVNLEAWIFFAILIIANCEKPLEAALKTFVFFLISQPLIYLIQVPFSELGWGLFGYYKYWAIWTLLTFPMAFIGWYMTRKDWVSVLVLSPALAFLGITAYQCATFCIGHFPYQLVAALFCILQIVVYVLAFFPDVPKRVVGLLIPIAAAAVFTFAMPRVDIGSTVFLPDNPVLSDSAIVSMDDNSNTKISIEQTGEESMIFVRSTVLGDCDFSIKDGDKTYNYTAHIYEDNSGSIQIDIVAR